MANKRNLHTKRMSRKARSMRRKKAEKDEAVRVIVSTKAVQNLLNIVVNHKCNGKLIFQNRSSHLMQLHCTGCNKIMKVRKDPKQAHQLPLFDAISAGALCAGIGYNTIRTLFSSMEIPIIARTTYDAAEQRVGEILEQRAKEEYITNGALEKQLATDAGDIETVGSESYPFISVTVDAGWAKRSYGHSYSSNAGVAVIIGARTRKILFMDSRIKTCILCDQFNHMEDKPDILLHKCYKNWTDSSQSREADILVNGFLKSLSDHGLIYRYLIGDADSSVYARIQAQVVYPGRIPIVKVDCAVRGLNSKLYSVVNNTAFPKPDRDAISTYINRFGKDARVAITHNHHNQKDPQNPTSAASLAKDIVNIPSHIMGDHRACLEYFCKNVGSFSENFSKWKVTGAGKEVVAAFHRLANRAPRLIYNITNNNAETFMTIMNKCSSGKRTNYAQRGGYHRRTLSAVLAYNNGAFWLPEAFENTCEIWTNAVQFFKHESRRGPKKPATGPFQAKSKTNVKNNLADEDYGPEAVQGLMTDSEIQIGLEHLVDSLQVTIEQRDQIQKDTIGQSYNDNWKYERRNRLTASSCGRIYRLRDWTPNNSILKSILYPVNLGQNENIKRGINLEPDAKNLYSFLNEVDVTECGLFIDLTHGILGASPDGVIGDDGILEVKCTNCVPEQIPKRPDNFLVNKSKTDSSLTLRRSHKYYYQIVAQLHITGRKFCDLFVYYQSKDDPSKTAHYQERINRDDVTETLWKDIVRQVKLVKFFREDMAPEIISPMFPKVGKFRTPAYRSKAIEDKASTNKQKLSQKSTKANVIPMPKSKVSHVVIQPETISYYFKLNFHLSI